MKKALIVSLYDDLNYGNKLQNYAVYKIIKSHGIDVINVKNNRHLNYQGTSHLKSNIKFVLSKTKWFIKKRITFGLKYYKIRKRNFKMFSSKIKTSRHYFSYSNIKKFDNKDYLFVGSDQVWNPYMSLDDLSLFRGFKNGKKVSISASFGVSEIDSFNKNRLTEALNDFSYLSVRESAGKNIVDSLNLNKECYKLIDPTLAISSEEWNKEIIKPAYTIPKKYILLAFLGELDNKVYEQINDFAEENGLEIIDLYKKNSCWTSCGPSEFLFLEKNAALIFTDSFHSAVFGIIFNRPFVVTGRNGTKENMNSRIDTLLKTFKLDERKYNGSFNKKIFDIDYTTTNNILKNEQITFNNFIDNIFMSDGE